MALIDKDQIRAEIERRRKETTDTFVEQRKLHGEETIYWQGQKDAYGEFLAFLDSLPEQPVEYPTSTEMIAEWENNELPLLRDKDFRGDAERMAYNAFMDGFAKGLGYKK